MPGGQGGVDRRASDASRSALEFVHALLGRGAVGAVGLDGLLKDLAAAFAAAGAGLAVLTSGKVLARRPAGDGPLPWEEDAELAERVLRAPAALSGPRRAGGGRPACDGDPAASAAPGWLLWVESDDARPRLERRREPPPSQLAAGHAAWAACAGLTGRSRPLGFENSWGAAERTEKTWRRRPARPRVWPTTSATC